MQALPRVGPRDPNQLSDWLEINALSSSGGMRSAGDLERALHASPLFHGESPDSIEQTIDQVFEQIYLRTRNAGDGYPFELGGSIISIRGDWRERSSYAFCLLVAHYGGSDYCQPEEFPRRIFESLSTEVAKCYLKGQAVRFASPRIPSELPRGFKDAVDQLCKHLLREGVGYQVQPTRAGMDRALDVVAWRDIDERPGKIILFAGCASGEEWEDKLTELNPEAFCRNWMIDSPTIWPIKAFFTSHVVSSDKWKYCSTHAGLIFDRCRISATVKVLPPADIHGDGLSWAERMIAELSGVE